MESLQPERHRSPLLRTSLAIPASPAVTCLLTPRRDLREGPTCESDLESIAWYSNNSDSTTQPVALKKPNAWGLHDMIGNVSEWFSSYKEYRSYYSTNSVVDPEGPATGADRVCRGGGWTSIALHSGAACAHGHAAACSNDGLGFRVALRFTGN